MSDGIPVEEIRRLLLRWYDRHRRDLPWRKTRDPYRIWLSEVMLQQTQVRTVLPYYKKFLARFPTLESFARARLDEVLALWSGMGYYNRIRNMHRAAGLVLEEGGEFPRDLQDARRLPGVGRYTAGAVLSIAFGQRQPVVDGNVLRVLARLYKLRGRPHSSRFQDRIWKKAEALVPRRRPGDFNQALMELGATVCTPASPACGRCPLEEQCLARRAGIQEKIPPPLQRRAPGVLHVAAALVRRPGQVLLVRHQDGGVPKGFWQLPSSPCHAAAGSRKALERLVSRWGGRVREKLFSLEHVTTMRRIVFHVFRAEAPKFRPAAVGGQWVSPDQLEHLPHSASLIKILTRACSI
ncbi:MAG: A/G-specific adenine glycosylase [Acidobacteria bacterium]|nr:A/G-specific adenine glycosylase [Acidobacteriota bacterium]